MKPKSEIKEIKLCKKHKMTLWERQPPIIVPNQPVVNWKERHCKYCGYTEGIKNL